MSTLTVRKAYRSRVKSSKCRGRAPKGCKKSMGCKRTKKTANKKSYCRKRSNRHL